MLDVHAKEGVDERLQKYQPLWGHWKITRQIGSGSTSYVYEVENDLHIKSALKVIPLLRKQMNMKLEKEAFLLERKDKKIQEIKYMSELRGCPGIVAYEDYECIEIWDTKTKELLGYDILIRMELLESLLDRMNEGELFTPDEVGKIGCDVLGALSAAYDAAKLVHRDIKPDNIFISKQGDYKIGDFGVATCLEEDSLMATCAGTGFYMAPEVYKRQKRYNINVDVYSVGVVMYQLANQNRLPFVQENMSYSEVEHANERRVFGDTIPAIKGIDAELNRIILKACAYKPEKRYSNPKEMLQDMQKEKKSVSHKKLWYSVGAGIAALVIMLGVWLLTRGITPEKPDDKGNENVVSLAVDADNKGNENVAALSVDAGDKGNENDASLAIDAGDKGMKNKGIGNSEKTGAESEPNREEETDESIIPGEVKGKRHYYVYDIPEFNGAGSNMLAATIVMNGMDCNVSPFDLYRANNNHCYMTYSNITEKYDIWWGRVNTNLLGLPGLVMELSLEQKEALIKKTLEFFPQGVVCFYTDEENVDYCFAAVGIDEDGKIRYSDPYIEDGDYVLIEDTYKGSLVRLDTIHAYTLEDISTKQIAELREAVLDTAVAEGEE